MGKKFSDADTLADNDLLNRYLKSTKTFPVFTRDEERAHFMAYELAEGKKKERIRNFIASSNARLVFSIARKVKRSGGLHILDLVQEGNFGLFRAIEKFDWRKEFKFSSYATYWISSFIYRAVTNNGNGAVRYPVHLDDIVIRVYMIRSRLEKELGREPKAVEIWFALKKRSIEKNQPILGLDVVGQTIKILAEGVDSFDAPIREDNEQTLLDITNDSQAVSADLKIEARERLAEVLPALKRIEAYVETLRPRTAQVLTYRLGLFGKGRLTFEEVSERYDVTRQRIQQIEADSLISLEAETGFARDEVIQLVDMETALEEVLSSSR